MDASGTPGTAAGTDGHPEGPREPEPHTLRLAWILFLAFGLPFLLMGVLTILARGGVYVDLFRVLYQSWPPDVLKPFLGIGVFVVTLAYLTYRVGRRAGFHKGAVAGVVFVRNQIGEAIRPVTPEPMPAAALPPELPPTDSSRTPVPAAPEEL